MKEEYKWHVAYVSYANVIEKIKILILHEH